MRQCFFGVIDCQFFVTSQGHGFGPILASKFRFFIILKLVTTNSSQFFFILKYCIWAIVCINMIKIGPIEKKLW